MLVLAAKHDKATPSKAKEARDRLSLIRSLKDTLVSMSVASGNRKDIVSKLHLLRVLEQGMKWSLFSIQQPDGHFALLKEHKRFHLVEKRRGLREFVLLHRVVLEMKEVIAELEDMFDLGRQYENDSDTLTASSDAITVYECLPTPPKPRHGGHS